MSQQNKQSLTRQTLAWVGGLALLLSAATQAESTSYSGLQGTYFAKSDFSEPRLQRIDARPSFHWVAEPASGLPKDHFSVRWSGQLIAPSTGDYQLLFRHDDHLRVFIDGEQKLQVNSWDRGTAAELPLTLTANEAVSIVIELRELGGPGQIDLHWITPGTTQKTRVPKSALRFTTSSGDRDHDGSGDALDNCPLVANPNQRDVDNDGRGDACDSESEYQGLLLTHHGRTGGNSENSAQIATTINHNWGHNQPNPRVRGNWFSSLWQGSITASETGEHTLIIGHDDGMKLDIGQQQFRKNSWDAGKPYQAKIHLTAGQALPISFLLNERGGNARASLQWIRPSANGVAEIVPSSAFSWQPERPAPVVPDQDSDSVEDTLDNCPSDFNPEQADLDADGVGDACDTLDNRDDDGDEVDNHADNCPAVANSDQADLDGDGLGNACDSQDDRDTDSDGVPAYQDNCQDHANPEQTDTDGDGMGDACDTQDNRDGDSDGVENYADNCPSTGNADQTDKDSDGLGDACDSRDDRDPDEDGVIAEQDNCPAVANPDQNDSDADGQGNACDLTSTDPAGPCATLRGHAQALCDTLIIAKDQHEFGDRSQGDGSWNPSDFAALLKAHDAGRAVMDNPNSSDSEHQQAWQALTTAIDKFESQQISHADDLALLYADMPRGDNLQGTALSDHDGVWNDNGVSHQVITQRRALPLLMRYSQSHPLVSVARVGEGRLIVAGREGFGSALNLPMAGSDADAEQDPDQANHRNDFTRNLLLWASDRAEVRLADASSDHPYRVLAWSSYRFHSSWPVERLTGSLDTALNNPANTEENDAGETVLSPAKLPMVIIPRSIISADVPRLADYLQRGGVIMVAMQYWNATADNVTQSNALFAHGGIEMQTDSNWPNYRTHSLATLQAVRQLADSDGDGISDEHEDINANGQQDGQETQTNNADTDGDGLPDSEGHVEGVLGQYFADGNFAQPAFSRLDPQINFSWGSGSPRAGFPSNNFSVRWKGALLAPTTGDYQLHVSHDDGVTINVAGTEVFKNSSWDRNERGQSTSFNLSSEVATPIQLDYFEGGGGAHMRLYWTGPGIDEPTLIPSSAWRWPGSHSSPLLADTDGDGLNDGVDNDPAVADYDIDRDGVFNINDQCADTQDNGTVNGTGCADYQRDTDGDGYYDHEDAFANDATAWRDIDGDGVADNRDNCPEQANADQNPAACRHALATALSSADASDISEADLIAAIQKLYDEEAPARRRAVRDAIFRVGQDDAIDGLQWHPTHDSAWFGNLDISLNVPLLMSTHARRTSDHNAQPLAIARQNPNGSRTLVFGGGVFSDTTPNGGRTGSANAAMTELLQSAIAWATHSDPSIGEFKVVMSQMESYYWFPYAAGTTRWFSENYPNAELNPEGGCDNGDLGDCLAGSQLLIVGVSETEGLDKTALLRDIEAFQARGGAVIVLQSDHFNGLSGALLSHYGLVGNSNTAQEREIISGSATDLPLTVAEDSIKTMFDNLVDANFLPNFAACVAERTWLKHQTWRSCDAEPFLGGFRRGADQLRNVLARFDDNSLALFSRDGLDLLKLYVLLGDKLRAAISYPIAAELTSGASDKPYLRAIFSDVSVTTVRSNNARQTDLGSLYCPERFVQRGSCADEGWDFDAWQESVPRLSNISHGDQARKVTEWTTTGYSAMPGEAVTIRRLDDSDLTVKVKLFYQRVGTSRTFSATNRYSRPQYVESRYMPLPADGQPLTFSSPWGGPIYLHIEGSDALAGSPVEVQMDGVVRHLAVLDASDDGEIDDFVIEVPQNPLPTIDIRGEGFEAHMRRDKLLGSLTADYTLPMLLDEYRFDFIEPVYRLAGFKAPGKTMAETLSASVKSICASHGWDCLNDDFHTRERTQHSNYDDHAHCGAGCAGNPWDSAYNVSPLGWLEGHELGHNLQRRHFNIHYVTEANKNDWGEYANRSGEVSNNVFPYFMKWRKYRLLENRPYTAAAADDTAPEGHIKPLRMWSAMQSAQAGLTREINGETRKVLIEYKKNADINGDGTRDHCHILADYPVNEAEPVAKVSWTGTGIYDQNGERFSFYQGIPPLIDDQVMADGTVLSDGFEYITLMYEVSRIINEHGKDDSDWNDARDTIGFGLFPRSGSNTYDGRDIRHIPGNDLIVVALSYLSGIDFRPYFDLREVRYSDLADQQVQAHVNSGRIQRTVGDASVPHFMPVIQQRLPKANLADTPRAAIDGDPETLWPDADMPNGGWTPLTCPQ